MPKRRTEPMIPVAVEPQMCPDAVRWWMDGVAKYEKKSMKVREKARRHMSAVGWKFWHARLEGDKPVELRYQSPTGKLYYSLKTACKACVDLGCVFTGSESMGSNSSDRMEERKESKSPETQSKPKKRGRKRKIQVLQRPEEEEEHESLEISANRKPGGKVLAELKRLRVSDPPKLQIRSPRTILSSLIDNKVVMLNAKVYYRGRRINDGPLARGQVSREGIKCDCCSKVFALTAFEAHAGSTNHRPGANIILDEDGRSISDCQRQMKGFKDEKMGMKKSNKSDKNDDICSLCHNEGELILCDTCPSAFHTSCLGLSEVADGDWFCPSCCCGICASGKIEQGADGQIMKCDQCEHKYHVGCLRENGEACEGKWFCSSKCQNIQFGLKGLLGLPISVGDNNLTWTLLKSFSTSFDRKDLRETHRKLRLALSVLHKCFEPSVDPYTQRDLVEDIVLNRESKLRRLNFRGFYTVILERSKEVICVATVRIYREVAEVPLVATMFRHRRLGMCRILMNELEKQLIKLGIERLVLPSAPSALDTWTNTSIGFSKMTDAEKSEFVNHFFLYFQGTVMCHKPLKQRSPATQAIIPEENMEHDESSGGISIITEAED